MKCFQDVLALCSLCGWELLWPLLDFSDVLCLLCVDRRCRHLVQAYIRKKLIPQQLRGYYSTLPLLPADRDKAAESTAVPQSDRVLALLSLLRLVSAACLKECCISGGSLLKVLMKKEGHPAWEPAFVMSSEIDCVDLDVYVVINKEKYLDFWNGPPSSSPDTLSDDDDFGLAMLMHHCREVFTQQKGKRGEFKAARVFSTFNTHPSYDCLPFIDLVVSFFFPPFSIQFIVLSPNVRSIAWYVKHHFDFGFCKNILYPYDMVLRCLDPESVRHKTCLPSPDVLTSEQRFKKYRERGFRLLEWWEADQLVHPVSKKSGIKSKRRCPFPDGEATHQDQESEEEGGDEAKKQKIGGTPDAR